MRLVLTVARWETIALIGALGIVTLWRLFSDATFSGLLRSGDGTISPGRIQMLVVTVLAALQYQRSSASGVDGMHTDILTEVPGVVGRVLRIEILPPVLRVVRKPERNRLAVPPLRVEKR